jgi:hypothetical protein
MELKYQHNQHSFKGFLVVVISCSLLLNVACNLITSDPCDDSEANEINVNVQAKVNLSGKKTGEPLKDVPVYLTISKQPCGGEKKGMFYFNNSSDSLGIIYSDQVKYTISNLNDLIFVDAMVECNDGRQGLWSSSLTYNDFIEKGLSQVMEMNLEIDIENLKQAFDSLEVSMK